MDVTTLLVDDLNVALWMMRAKPVRAALSLLGIYIGALSLIIILSIHEGTRRSIEDLYRTQNAHVFLVMPAFDQASMKTGTLSLDQAAQLKAQPGITSVLARTHSECEVRSRDHATQAQILGIDTAFIPVYRIPLQAGRIFLESEITLRQPVCLLTDHGAEKLFPLENAVGKSLNVLGTAFDVIGVVRWSPAVTQRTSVGMEPDLLVPATWMEIGNGPHQGPILFSMLEVRADLTIPAKQIILEISTVLSHGDPNRSKLYGIASLEDYLQGMRESTSQMLRSLLAIAAISLIVGGIGVANVMLTSVTERTREIGVRKALGARRFDIILQFLLESSVLTASAGAMAVITGSAGIALIPLFIHVTLQLIIPKLLVSSCLALTFAIGLIAGAYPAARASSLSPTEALRYE